MPTKYAPCPSPYSRLLERIGFLLNTVQNFKSFQTYLNINLSWILPHCFFSPCSSCWNFYIAIDQRPCIRFCILLNNSMTEHASKSFRFSSLILQSKVLMGYTGTRRRYCMLPIMTITYFLLTVYIRLCAYCSLLSALVYTLCGSCTKITSRALLFVLGTWETRLRLISYTSLLTFLKFFKFW